MSLKNALVDPPNSLEFIRNRGWTRTQGEFGADLGTLRGFGIFLGWGRDDGGVGVPKTIPNKTQGGNFSGFNPRVSYGNCAAGPPPCSFLVFIGIKKKKIRFFVPVMAKKRREKSHPGKLQQPPNIPWERSLFVIRFGDTRESTEEPQEGPK